MSASIIQSNARIESQPVSTSGSRSDDLSDNAHRQLIGYVGLVLPVLLIFIAMNRDGIEQWKKLESISAYYYTGAVAAFVGMLVSLSFFLFTYRGYANKFHAADRIASVTAAISALGVALFPTKSPDGVATLSWWTPATGIIHHVCAIILFGTFAVFALWLFRLKPEGAMQVPSDKEWRNRVYLICGIMIVASMIWAGISARNKGPIFWPESVALVFFAISWLVKGYAARTIVATVRSLSMKAK